MGKADSIRAVRGMKDMLPADAPCWQRVESVCRSVMARYTYQEIRTPCVEQTALFSRSVGENTDIVSKEMYTFEDRNGDSLSLRPEGTASVVRAGIEAGLFYNQWQRLWYIAPMFRHERPQRGRYRQFHQVGVETYGYAGPSIEAEVIAISHQLLSELGLADDLVCEINQLGTVEERAAFREALVAYLMPYKEDLDADSQERLLTNPLRILDTKVDTTRALLGNAPDLQDFLSQESKQHLETLRHMLNDLGVSTKVNRALVRGLDYYTGVVFEWVTNSLGAQGTVCAGGRYDGLVEQLGGHATPAFGFGAGLERLVLMLQEKQDYANAVDVVVLAENYERVSEVLSLAAVLRCGLPNVTVSSQLAGGSFKSQMKRVDKLQASYACVIQDNGISFKSLKTRDTQHGLSQEDVVKMLKKEYSNE